MNKVVIALGTASHKKIPLVNQVLDEIGVEVEVLPTEVESGVSSQPITEEETIKGSLNRASRALEVHKKADAALGIEVGYGLNGKGRYEIFCYASVLDNEGFSASCCSHKLLLPKMHNRLIEENKKMADYLEDYYRVDDHPATQYLAKMIDTRKAFIIESVRQAMLRYFRKTDFE